MLKANIRSQYLKKRDQISSLEKEAYDSKITDQFLDFLPKGTNAVHTFLPIASKNEINTWKIIKELWKRNIKVLVPSMVANSKEMISIEVRPGDEIEESMFKVPEPKDKLTFNGIIDLVILPLVAFDQRGFRVGYGMGYYDQFFEFTGLPTYQGRIELL